jgi:hypothetical protein
MEGGDVIHNSRTGILYIDLFYYDLQCRIKQGTTVHYYIETTLTIPGYPDSEFLQYLAILTVNLYNTWLF